MVCLVVSDTSFIFSSRSPPLPQPAHPSLHTGASRSPSNKPLCRPQSTQVTEAPQELAFLGFQHAHITAYNGLLRNAGDEKELAMGRLLHAHIILMGYLPDLFLANLLIQMYGKCGAIDDVLTVFASMHQTNVFSWTLLMGALIQSSMLDSARIVFDCMPERDVTSWNSMLAAYSQNERDIDTLELFELMQMEGCIPDSLTFVSVLTACAHVRDLRRTWEMHASILSWGLEGGRDLMNPLINMYNKCGSVEDTKSVFNKLEERTVFAWNALIAVHAREGYATEAFNFYKQMQMHGTSTDDVTFITLLGLFDSQDDLTDGRQMHVHIVETALEQEVMIGNSLLSMYGRCGSVEDAQRMFNRMCKRNVITWNALITVHAQHGHTDASLAIFSEMEMKNIELSKVTFIAILDVCATAAALSEGKKVHARLSRSAYLSDFVIMTTLLNMYGRCGSLGDAREIFDSMTEKDVISWNAMIAAYVHNGIFDKASELFQKMQKESMQPTKVTFANVLIAYANEFSFDDGVDLHACIVGDSVELDTLVGNSLINFYSKCGRIGDAWRMFNKLPERDTVSWNAMISAYSQHGHGKEAFHTFQEMQTCGHFPSEVTFLSLLTAFSHSGLVNEGYLCFSSMLQVYSAAPKAEHYNIMVDLLGRAGKLDDAEAMIEKMHMAADTTTWMGFLGACRIHLDFARGIQSAAHVLDLDPDYNPAYVVLSDLSTVEDAAYAWDNLKE
eukprot:c12483_g1_i1 orf=27-2213(+)